MEWAPYERGGVHVQAWDRRAVDVFGFVRDQVVKVRPAVGVEHIGSTSVPDLQGKGTVDVMVLPPTADTLLEVVASLEQLGMDHAPGSLPRRPFLFSAVSNGETVINVHVHVIVAGDDEAATQRGFAAALRTDPQLRDQYATVKQRVVDSGIVDPVQYSIDKGDWVVEALSRLGLPPLPDNGPPPPKYRQRD